MSFSFLLHVFIVYQKKRRRRRTPLPLSKFPSPFPSPSPSPSLYLPTYLPIHPHQTNHPISFFFKQNPELPSIHLHPNNLHPHPPRRPHVPNQKLSSFNNHQQTRMDRNRTSPDLQIFANSHDADFSGKIPCAHDKCATLVVFSLSKTTRRTK